jgi:hypothetical protein
MAEAWSRGSTIMNSTSMKLPWLVAPKKRLSGAEMLRERAKDLRAQADTLEALADEFRYTQGRPAIDMHLRALARMLTR